MNNLLKSDFYKIFHARSVYVCLIITAIIAFSGVLMNVLSMALVEKYGEDALSAFLEAPEHTFACVLMDMRMPKMDGIRATAAIRASDRADARTIPIIGVSANGYADDIRKARQSGIDEYITKPIDRDGLLAAMSRLIRRG